MLAENKNGLFPLQNETYHPVIYVHGKKLKKLYASSSMIYSQQKKQRVTVIITKSETGRSPGPIIITSSHHHIKKGTMVVFERLISYSFLNLPNA